MTKEEATRFKEICEDQATLTQAQLERLRERKPPVPEVLAKHLVERAMMFTRMAHELTMWVEVPI